MLAWPDIVIIVGYFVIVFGLGAIFTGNIKSQKDFFLAGKKMPWWIAACSLQATDIGTETYIGVTGIVAATGLAWLNYDWLPACAIPCIISAWFFIRHFLKSGVYTIPEFIEKRYNSSMRALWGVLFIIARTLTLGVVIYTMALPLSLIVGWPSWLSLLIAAGVTGAYCFLGGLTSVMITDVFQFIIMTVCAAGLITFSLKAVGGWSGLHSALPRQMFHVVLSRAEGTADTWWGAMFIGTLSLGLPYWCTDQNTLQRAFACKSDADARTALVVGSIMKYPMTFIWGLVGLCVAVLFPQMIKENPDNAMPKIITTLLPVGTIGAAVTALYAAGMSSCDSLLASMSAVLTRDIYQRFLVKNKSDVHYLWAGRVFVILLLIGGTLFATKVYPLFGSAYKAWQSVLSYIQFPLFASLAIGIFYKRATALPAFIGLLAGAVSAFVLDRFVGPVLTPYWWSFVWASWAGGIITALITVCGSQFTKPYPNEKLKGLCWGTIEKSEQEKPALLMDWRLWSIVSLVVGIALTLIFWLVL
jgi:SSS family solute:Na+ symporter